MESERQGPVKCYFSLCPKLDFPKKILKSLKYKFCKRLKMLLEEMKSLEGFGLRPVCTD